MLKKLEVVGVIVGLLALIVAIWQLAFSAADSSAQENVQGTQVALMQTLVSVQEKVSTVEAQKREATADPIKSNNLEATSIALTTQEAGIRAVVTPTAPSVEEKVVFYQNNFEENIPITTTEAGNWYQARESDQSNNIVLFGSTDNGEWGKFFVLEDFTSGVIEYRFKVTKSDKTREPNSGEANLFLRSTPDGYGYVLNFVADRPEQCLMYVTPENWEGQEKYTIDAPQEFINDTWYSVLIYVQEKEMYVDVNGRRIYTGYDSRVDRGRVYFIVSPYTTVQIDDVFIWK